MKLPHSPWQPDGSDEPTRDIFTAELESLPGIGGELPVASEVGGMVEWAVNEVRRWFRKDRKADLSPSRVGPVARSATQTAVGALEGTLKSKSLDGELREAQVLDTYASIRQRNASSKREEAEALKLEAEAVKLQAEAEQIRAQTRIEREERALIRLLEVISKIENAVGAPVNIVYEPNGRVIITVGEGLTSRPDEFDGSLPAITATSAPTEFPDQLPHAGPSADADSAADGSNPRP
jgi:hypothetical protein